MICDFLNNSEIKADKYMLYKSYYYRNIIYNSTERRTTENRSNMMATCCDIIDDLFQLEDENFKFIYC